MGVIEIDRPQMPQRPKTGGRRLEALEAADWRPEVDGPFGRPRLGRSPSFVFLKRERYTHVKLYAF